MVYLPIKKLLSEYFHRPDLQQACSIMDEPTSYTNEELEGIILNEWERHGLNKYELFDILDRSKLSRICKAYNLDHRGNKDVLLRRIKKAKLLDDTKKPYKIGGISVIVVVAAFLTIYSAGIDTLGVVNDFFGINDVKLVECIHGESGIVYQNCPLNFELTKPNRDWKFFENFQVNTPKFNLHFPGESIVDGVLVERSHNEQVLVVVFDDNVNLDLKEFVDKELEIAGKSGLELEIIYTLPSQEENDVTMEWHFTNPPGNTVERIIKHDEKIFVVHGVIRNLDETTSKVEKEMEEIVKSFNFLS